MNQKKPYLDGDTSLMDEQTLEMLTMISHLMDKAFTIPGTNIKMGVDSVIGLIPGIGDTISLAVSGYIFSFAKRAGVPWHKRAHMLGNILVDWIIGIVPLIGDIFDIGWKANVKNVEIIKSHYLKQKDAHIIEGDYTKIS